MRIFAAPESGSPIEPRPVSRVVIPFPVRPKRKVSGVVPPQPKSQGTSAAMSAHAELKDLVPESERALAQEIAKAMQPPLMSRLARVQSSYSGLELSGLDDKPAPLPADEPPSVPALEMPLVVQRSMPAASAQPSQAMLDLIADDPDAGFSTPPAAEWLGKARRARNRARWTNAIAWIATLAIAGGIVTATMLALPH
jgi:hypothetical protein